MDYDKTEIATTYDRARALVPETARLWRDLLAEHIDRSMVSLIIDLGCGTGRFSELFAAHFGVQVIGVDPSQKMLDQARLKPASDRVTYQRGSAEAIPLPDGCADLVFMSNIYHHLADPVAAAREVLRVLHQDGRVCIRNGTQEADFPHRHFFPGLRALIDSELPSRTDITAAFIAGGFKLVIHQVITQVIAPDWSSFVEKSALRADSFLTRLSHDDFHRGMASLRAHGGQANGSDPVTEEIDWFVFAGETPLREQTGPPAPRGGRWRTATNPTSFEPW
jgi:ubiquinone/menaquinone biosynthesis C-methylase UbiE